MAPRLRETGETMTRIMTDEKWDPPLIRLGVSCLSLTAVQTWPGVPIELESFLAARGVGRKSSKYRADKRSQPQGLEVSEMLCCGRAPAIPGVAE